MCKSIEVRVQRRRSPFRHLMRYQFGPENFLCAEVNDYGYLWLLQRAKGPGQDLSVGQAQRGRFASRKGVMLLCAS